MFEPLNPNLSHRTHRAQSTQDAWDDNNGRPLRNEKRKFENDFIFYSETRPAVRTELKRITIRLFILRTALTTLDRVEHSPLMLDDSARLFLSRKLPIHRQVAPRTELIRLLVTRRQRQMASATEIRIAFGSIQKSQHLEAKAHQRLTHLEWPKIHKEFLGAL
jgi:hypothetical protein